MRTKGFTLIELLVVISIIALLSSVVLASLNTARAKARDSERIAELKAVQTALELYRTDNGSYPSTGGTGNWRGMCSNFNPGGTYTTSGASGYVPGLAPTYVSVLPRDPKEVADSCYVYTSNGVDYMMLAWRTVEANIGNIPVALQRQNTSFGSTDRTYAVYSSGAVSW